MAASQDSRMGAILLRLELLSHGSTQAFNASGGHSGEPDDRMVALASGRPTFPHLKWREAYGFARSELAREVVISEASRELESWSRRVLPRVEGKPLAEIIIEDGEGFEPQLVAHRFNVDPAFVRRVRMRAGRGTEDGRPVVPGGESMDRVETVAAMHRRGLSQTQIAAVLGVSQPTVHRALREHKFRRAAA